MIKQIALSLIAMAYCFSNTVVADFTPISGWDNQLFPSYLIGTAAVKADSRAQPAGLLGDNKGLLGIEITSPHDDAEIEVTIECSEFAETSRFVGRLEKGGETYAIFPKMKYLYERLSQCAQATPANVTFRVVVDGSNAEEKSVNITFRSVNDCPLQVLLGDQTIDTSFTFASYVNEQHPFIDKLLREALDIGIVQDFTGYQQGTDEQTLLQVYSIWDLLVSRDVRYSNITTTAADSSIICSQNVRLLEETINNQQANCVDGSVLLVSILRKINIEAKLILVPGHCYVGFYLDADHKKFVTLETTLLGVELDEPENVDDLLASAIEESLRGEQSWPSFVAAIEVGMKQFADSDKKFEEEPDQYRIIDINVARQAGILPIPHRSKEVFVQFDHFAYDEEEDDEEMDGEEWDDEESDEDAE